MNRLEAAIVVAVVLIASWVVATALPEWSEVAWAGGVLLIFAVALVSLAFRARGMRLSGFSPYGALLRVHHLSQVRPADLERIELLTGWVAYSGHDFSQRIKPMIVQLLRRRLEISKGIRLQEGEAPPAGVLSNELAELIAPSHDHSSRSITTDDINRALDEIEAL
jgi:hypothetical protein